MKLYNSHDKDILIMDTEDNFSTSPSGDDGGLEDSRRLSSHGYA